jgi:hypothetical protein
MQYRHHVGLWSEEVRADAERLLVAPYCILSVAVVTQETWLNHYLEDKNMQRARHEPQLNCWDRRWYQTTGSCSKDTMAASEVLFAAAEEKERTIVVSVTGILASPTKQGCSRMSVKDERLLDFDAWPAVVRT